MEIAAPANRPGVGATMHPYKDLPGILYRHPAIPALRGRPGRSFGQVIQTGTDTGKS
jgi:hypothetical protein